MATEQNRKRSIVKRRPPPAARPHAIVHREPTIGATPRPARPAAAPVRLPRTAIGGSQSRRAPWHAGWLPSVGRFTAAAICAAVLIAAMGAGSYWLYRGSALRIDTIEVQGVTYVDPAEVAGAAGLDGKSLVTARLTDAEDRVATVPLVAAVSIERHWPRTVRVIVKERQPWGSWQQDGVRYTIDRDGVVMGTSIVPPPDSPVIRSSQAGTRLQGERVDIEAVQVAAELFTEAPSVLGVNISEVAFLDGKGVQVTTADGQAALFGDASGIAYKLAAWAAMAREAKRMGIKYTTVDLRSGQRPVLVQ